MKNYKIKFEGVELHAIGKKQTFTKVVDGETFKEAHLKLYNTHEHIRVISVNGKKYDPLEIYNLS